MAFWALRPHAHAFIFTSTLLGSHLFKHLKNTFALTSQRAGAWPANIRNVLSSKCSQDRATNRLVHEEIRKCERYKVLLGVKVDVMLLLKLAYALCWLIFGRWKNWSTCYFYYQSLHCTYFRAALGTACSCVSEPVMRLRCCREKQREDLNGLDLNNHIFHSILILPISNSELQTT